MLGAYVTISTDTYLYSRLVEFSDIVHVHSPTLGAAPYLPFTYEDFWVLYCKVNPLCVDDFLA